MADHKDRLSYAEPALSPNVFWVDLKELDLSEGAPVGLLDLGPDMDRVLSSEVSAALTSAEPFTFEPAK